MKNIILEKLNKIELQKNIKIIYAVEAGSRAYGLNSQQSDYDVRFIYIRPLDFYLKLEQTKDTLEFSITDQLDINGWDLQKTLRLLYASNPTIFEWFKSSTIYKETETSKELNETIKDYFIPQKSIHHYFSMAKKNYKEYFKEETVELKKYFYVLRPILACNYILQNQEPPPILFNKLQKQLPETLLEEANKLIFTRINEPNLKKIHRVKIIDEYITSQLNMIQQEIPKLPQNNQNKYNKLNDLFSKCIKEYNI